jgi:3-deoxy-manno-octulosonate cytidylyltransferase (CMP-KDO synthetase)
MSGVAIVIPARFASTRYPGKPLVPLKGAGGVAKPLIQRSWEAARRVPGIDRLYVATDSDEVADAARAFGAEVLMTSEGCRNGTERCAEAVQLMGERPDILVNLQGDAPLTPVHFVTALLDRLAAPDAGVMATAAVRCSADHARRLLAEDKAGRVGGTSVVTGDGGRALYFSKRPIPYLPETALSGATSPLRLHIGVYAYTPAALEDYASRPPSELELLEGLEQLRFLDAGLPVDVVDVAPPEWEIWELNNPSDVAPIEEALALMGAE